MEGDIKTDVLVVGGGLAGLLCAWKLKQQGIDCVLIEADRVMRGVSRNTTAKITSQHGLVYHKLLHRFGAEITRAYFDANENAIAQYAKMAQKIDCNFERKNNYIYALDSNEKIERELAALEKLSIRAQFAKDLPIPLAVRGAVCFENQAQFDPLKFAAGLLPDLTVFEHTPAREFAPNTVTTERGKITASKIIMATHFPLMNKHGGYFLKMYQQRSYVIALRNAADVDGMYLDAAEKGLSFRNFGNLLLLGGGGHRTGKQGGCWNELENFSKIHYPAARRLCRWAAQDCMTLDEMPYIGRYSRGTTDLYVATGFNKWGMTTSMVAADVLTDMVMGRRNAFEAVFDPSRSMLRPQLLVNAAESTLNLLIPTKPRCPHLGCALKWNPQEHSWDCSCHGSRFTKGGVLLDGPATGNANIKKEPS